MKFLIVFVALFAVALAAPVGDESQARIVSQDSDVQPDGFKTAYQTENGISAQEEGHLANVGTDHEALQVRGQFSYVGPDGQTYTIQYVANENGFQPQGAHIPVA